MRLRGFFKRGVYAERVRAILAELRVVALKGADDNDESFTSTTTTKALVLVSADVSSVEYEAFGFLAATNASASWTIEVLSPDGTVLERVSIEFNASFGQTWQIPWYIKGTDKTKTSFTGSSGYRVRCTENSGSGTLHVRAARLYVTL